MIVQDVVFHGVCPTLQLDWQEAGKKFSQSS